MKDNYCIALQPICDRDMRHIADELLYRSAPNTNAVLVHDDMLATARASQIAFYEVGIENLIGSRRLFVNTPKDWLLNPNLLPPKPHQVVIEVLESVEADSETIASLTRIRNRGYGIALDDFVLNSSNRPLLDVATIVKIDKWQSISSEEVAFYKGKGLWLLAEKVEEVEDFKRLRRLGFDYFQGYFYAKPEMRTATSRRRSSNKKVQIKILKELQKEYANFNVLEELIIQDPHLTFIILRQTNSVFYARVNKAYSIVEAINTLGLKEIKSIVLTVMLADNGAASRLLLPQILTRAAMCEDLAKQRQIDPDIAFTAGLLSLMDQLLGVPLKLLLQEVGLNKAEIDTIIDHKGPVGQLLQVVECFENAQTYGINADQIEALNKKWIKSRIWAEKILCASLN